MFSECPYQQGCEQNEAEGLNAFGFFQEQIVHNEGIFQEPEIALDAVLFLVCQQYLLWCMPHVAFGRGVREKHEASGLLTFLFC